MDDYACLTVTDTGRGMSGETLAALREIRPDIPVILASGYDEARVMAENHGEMPEVFLNKPYRIADLKAALDKILGPVSPQSPVCSVPVRALRR